MSDTIADLLKEADELPNPKRTMLTENEALLIDFCHRLAAPLRAARAVTPAPQAVPEWQPIETAPTDETNIIRWHRIWKCPVTVQRNNGRLPGYPEWITGTKDQTWPEDAFLPVWMPLPPAPAPAPVSGEA